MSNGQKSHRTAFPILLNKVFYSGTHSGDFLTQTQIRKLDAELRELRKLKLTDLGIAKSDVKWVSDIFVSLARLVKVAQRIGKPIAF